MIVTVTVNPAIDITYNLPDVRVGSTLRPERVNRRAGGKGVNVARVLRQLDQPVLALGTAGGHAGAQLDSELAAADIPHRFTPITDESRSTVALLSRTDGSATIVNEPGPELAEPEWSALLQSVREEVSQARVLVLSGSLPPGAPQDAYTQLVEIGNASNVPVILDSSGESLASGVTATPRFVKPNQDELAALSGLDDPRTAARAIHDRHSCGVIASLGPDGLLAVDAARSWHAGVPEPLQGNPVGAGDAAVAALAANLTVGADMPTMLADMVALSAAAVRAPLAGEVDLTYYHAHRDPSTVTELDKEHKPCH